MITTYTDLQEEVKRCHDREDRAILAERVTALTKISGPRCGDWLTLPDGTTARIAHHWGDTVQPSTGNGDTGSFYLGDAFADYSGGLEPGIPVERLQDTGESRDGRVWFFSRDMHMAHNGVHFTASFRVYRVTV